MIFIRNERVRIANGLRARIKNQLLSKRSWHDSYMNIEKLKLFLAEIKWR